MLNFHLIDTLDEEKLISIYQEAYSWDKNHMCFLGGQDTIEGIKLSKNYEMLENGKLIGYATTTPVTENLYTYQTIRRNFRPQISVPMEEITELACIIHPEYRKKGLGKELLDELTQIARLDYSSAVAYIDKTNIASISLVKSASFEYRCNRGNFFFYEKKLKRG